MKRDRYLGKIINERYELVRLIDEGGMGAVYLGRDKKLGRKAAIKLLRSELSAGSASVERFHREAKAASCVYHPNVISVFDLGVTERGEPYLVMEYLSGENIGSILKRRKTFDSATALGVMEPALRGLAAAHEQGIIHRDLKPENIFAVHIPDGAPIIKLIDFGISKLTDPNQPQLTQTGALLGTPAYMSPEQARGKGEFDLRTDLYSMGVILYLMLTGKHPFVGQSYNDLIFNILNAPPRDPFKLNPDFPINIAPVVRKLIEKDPAGRYADCKAVLADLEALDAFGERGDALRALAGDIQPDCFATGDLGSADEAPRPNDAAATVPAKEHPATSSHGKGNPHRASDREPSAAAKDEALSWDMISSRVIPSRTQARKKRSFAPFLGISVLLLFIGIAAVLWWDMRHSSLTASPALPNDASPAGVLPLPSRTSEKPSPPRDAVSSPADDDGQNTDNAAPITTDSKNDTEMGDTATGDTSTGDDSDAPSTPAGKDDTDDTVDTADTADTATDSEKAAPEPVSSRRLDELIEAQKDRIQNCYEMARMAEPSLGKGKLALRAVAAGDKIDVEIEKNELNDYLASCVSRVISSIEPPAADGTSVEVQREFEF